MVKIAPSLLSADFSRLKEELILLENAGADWLHLDVMDGHFVPNLTFGTPVIQKIREHTTLPLDVHLMVTNPEAYIAILAEIGVNCISFHQETVFHSHRLVSQIQEFKMLAGIALNPASPVEMLKPILADLDFVLLMSVNPGFGGQQFLPLVYEKIRDLRKISNLTKPNLQIEVDGGVNSGNAKELIQVGADILVAGSYIFSSSDYHGQIRRLKQCSEI